MQTKTCAHACTVSVNQLVSCQCNDGVQGQCYAVLCQIHRAETDGLVPEKKGSCVHAPAPLVSTSLSAGSAMTGYRVTRPLTATTVGELPWVITTVRPRLPFCLGIREICRRNDGTGKD